MQISDQNSANDYVLVYKLINFPSLRDKKMQQYIRLASPPIVDIESVMGYMCDVIGKEVL